MLLLSCFSFLFVPIWGNFCFILFYSESSFLFRASSLLLVVLIASLDTGPSEKVSPFWRDFTLFVFHPRHNTPMLASVSVPVPQTAKHHCRSSGRTHWSEKALQYTKRVLWSPQVDATKHTVWISVRTRECVCVCGTALLWQKFHLTCVSVYECVLCVLILFSTGTEVSLAKRSPLLLLSSLVLCVQGKADWLTDKLMALMQCTASFFHFQSIWSIF